MNASDSPAGTHPSNNPPPSPASGELISLLDPDGLARVLRHLTRQIAAKHQSTPALFLAGIPTRGVEIARRLAQALSESFSRPVPTGALDTSFYRDDLALRPGLPAPQTTELPINLNQCSVILVDDVLFTGRTARAALEALHAYGRPARVELAVLIDRGHRQLPIQPDYTGMQVPTDFNDRIRVRLENLDGIPDGVWLVRPVQNQGQPPFPGSSPLP